MTSGRAGPDEPEPRREVMEKLAILAAAGRLAGDELDAYLAEQGVTRAQLDDWKERVRVSLDPGPPSDTRAEKKKIRELERRLKRTDRDLAEARALLVLQEKVNAMFGERDRDDVEPDSSSPDGAAGSKARSSDDKPDADA